MSDNRIVAFGTSKSQRTVIIRMTCLCNGVLLIAHTWIQIHVKSQLRIYMYVDGETILDLVSLSVSYAMLNDLHIYGCGNRFLI